MSAAPEHSQVTPTVSRRKPRQRVFIPRLPAPTSKQPPRDAAMVYRAFCAELAAEIGFNQREVYECWEEIACMFEFEQGANRRMAEYLAMNATRAVLDKIGPGEPS